MKKVFLIALSTMSLFACSKKTADKMAQTTPSVQPAPEVVVAPSKPVEVVPKVEDKLNIPDGINPDLVVSLNRTPCFGSCPAYKVEIFKDGTVKYNGIGYVKRLGFFTSKADEIFIAEILKQAETINYMKFSNRYPIENVEISDMPQTISYIRLGSVGKMIQNNLDAPKELVAFERWLEKCIENLKWQEAKK
jgi:hypothetical protein